MQGKSPLRPWREVAMPEQGAATEAYAIQYSEPGRASRKELPLDAQSALFDVLDTLATNPDAFPGRVRAISRDGNVRLYSHPSPALQVTFRGGYLTASPVSLALRVPK